MFQVASSVWKINQNISIFPVCSSRMFRTKIVPWNKPKLLSFHIPVTCVCTFCYRSWITTSARTRSYLWRLTRRRGRLALLRIEAL